MNAPAFFAPRASRILRPGERVLPANVERYLVKGGGSIVVDVKTGDKLLLTDLEGGQRAEISFCDGQGRFDLSAIGAKPDGQGNGLRAMLLLDNDGAKRTQSALLRRNINLSAARTARSEERRVGKECA